MDTEEEEDILAIYVNLINMVNVFTNLQIDFIFSIRNYCKKKRYIKYFTFADKWQIVGYDSISVSCILSYLERTLSQFIP